MINGWVKHDEVRCGGVAEWARFQGKSGSLWPGALYGVMR